MISCCLTPTEQLFDHIMASTGYDMMMIYVLFSPNTLTVFTLGEKKIDL
jgi:hypothetical protein